MSSSSLDSLIQEAVLQFALGDNQASLALLDQALLLDENAFEAHLARAEVLYTQGNYEDALASAKKAQFLQPEDLHLQTTLSRVWMQLGNKEEAEAYGARAKVLSWKQQLAQPPPEPGNDKSNLLS
jgi:Flp pilus assembly protein TadD